jgi:hypothetical protein
LKFQPIKEKLELAGSYELHGIIESLAAGQLPKTPRQSLFLTFLDAKLSVVT